jgi:hypothetical protein
MGQGMGTYRGLVCGTVCALFGLQGCTLAPDGEAFAWEDEGSTETLGEAVVETASWSATASDFLGWYGVVVAGGDVNDDGFSDAVVGMPDSNGDAGKVLIYKGSATGLSATPSWTLSLNGDGSSSFGRSLAVGDVNGDGSADVIVGAPNYSHNQTYEGAVFAFYGSTTGPDNVYDWVKEGNQTSASYGFALALSDVDNNGSMDVIVGAPNYDGTDGTTTYTDGGAVWVYLGSNAGISDLKAQKWIGAQAGATFGYAVGNAGDTNGDDRQDILIGAPKWDNGHTDEGKVFLYRGFATPPNNPTWTVEGNQTSARFGHSVAGAFVNIGNFSDVIIGAPYYDDGQTDEGKVFIYHGTSATMSTTATSTLQANVASARFGWSVANAGDVDKDILAVEEVIVGSPKDGTSSAGKARLYKRSGEGVWSVDWEAAGVASGDEFGISVASAGSVNGDTKADVIVGAWLQDDGADQNAGFAYVYHGD